MSDPDQRRVVLCGSHPQHSRSPAIWAAAFDTARLGWRYDVVAVADGHFDAAAATLLADDTVAGICVTMPHKLAAAQLADQLDWAGGHTGAVNLLRVDVDGRIIGHNTDVAGFDRSLRDHHVNPTGARCVIVGAGGAARAVLCVLASAGAADIAVVARRGADDLAATSPSARTGSGSDIADADIVVNTTPVGMAGGGHADELPIDPALLEAHHVVVDCVTTPATTPLLAAAHATGATCVDGLGMLTHQAAVAFELCCDQPAPLVEMHAAALASTTTH